MNKTSHYNRMTDSLDDVYTLFNPDPSAFECPIIVDSPHSGTLYPKDFHYSCAHDLLKKGEDLYVDELFDEVPNLGGYLLRAEFSRSYLDLNRSLEAIDPDLCADHWPGETNDSERVKYGMGLIRRLAKPGVPVYSRKLTNAEIQHRIDDYYRPYYAALSRIIDNVSNKFGMMVHLNAHSMPARTLEGVRHPDFVFGDRLGQTCDPAIRNVAVHFLRDKGYRVTVNTPYQGVELISRFSDKSANRHSMQLEINKGLYMNETTYKKNKSFGDLKMVLSDMMAALADYTRAHVNGAAAAE